MTMGRLMTMTMMMKTVQRSLCCFVLATAFMLPSNSTLVVSAAPDAVIYQSTAAMNLNIEKKAAYTVDEIYTQVELATTEYLAPLLKLKENPDANKVLNTHVSVVSQVQVPENERVILEMVVAIIYIVGDGQAIQVAEFLANVVDPHELALALDVPSLSASYGPADATVKLQTMDGNRTAADKGLIATTVFLAIGLVMLASTVLWVTGGCNSCQSCCMNLLFEEISEEELALEKQQQQLEQQQSQQQQPHNFQVNTYDEESVSMSSVSNSMAMQTNPSGVLGANHNDSNNPAAGLGIKTPGRPSEYDDSEMLGIDDTPMSQAPTGQIGITSIRKMYQQQQTQQPGAVDSHHQQQQQREGSSSSSGTTSAGGGLANMIMQRLNLNENNK